MDARTAASDPAGFATLEDVRHVLGEVEDVVIAEILSVRPTYRDLSEAAIWAHGYSDLAARERGELRPAHWPSPKSWCGTKKVFSTTSANCETCAPIDACNQLREPARAALAA